MKRTQPTSTPASSPTKLDEKQLTEYRLRHAVLTRIGQEQLMIQESYARWIQDTIAAKGLKGKFRISLDTGEITPVQEQQPN